MRISKDYIGGEITIGFDVGIGADGGREIHRQHMVQVIFAGRGQVPITLNLADFRDKSGRTIGDLLAERGEDVFKIIDEET